MAPAEVSWLDRSRQGGAPMVALSKPLTYLILHVLAAGAFPQPELMEVVAAARATCFRHLLELEELGVVTRWRREGSRSAYCGLTRPAGEEFLGLANLLLGMFSTSEMPSAAGEVSVRVRGLTAGWNTTALRWLAEDPCSVRDLDRQAPSGIGLPEMTAAREALLAGGFIAGRREGRPRRFELTALGDELARPLAAAVLWHRRHLADRGLPLTTIDAETLLMLAARNLDLPDDTRGGCRLSAAGSAGVEIEVGNGILAIAPTHRGQGGPEIRGSIDLWLSAMAEHDVSGLSRGSEDPIEEAVLDALAAKDRGATQ